MEIAAAYNKTTNTLDNSSSRGLAGLFGAALSRPDCDDVRNISYCKKTKLVGVACGKLWAILDTTKDPLPSDMPLHNGKWMESNPHLIHYSSPTDGDTILQK